MIRFFIYLLYFVSNNELLCVFIILGQNILAVAVVVGYGVVLGFFMVVVCLRKMEMKREKETKKKREK